jgi:hypothetical protein
MADDSILQLKFADRSSAALSRSGGNRQSVARTAQHSPQTASSPPIALRVVRVTAFSVSLRLPCCNTARPHSALYGRSRLKPED